MIRTKYLSLMIAAVLVCGCQKAANTSTNSNTSGTFASNANANSASTASNASANVSGDFNGTPIQVYKAAYMAREKCDVAALQKVMAKGLLDRMSEFAKEDKKSLDDEFKELCKDPQASTAEARNEKIDGDHATIEYLDAKGRWQPMSFVREEGVWKMSFDAPGEDAPDTGIDNKEDNRS